MVQNTSLPTPEIIHPWCTLNNYSYPQLWRATDAQCFQPIRSRLIPDTDLKLKSNPTAPHDWLPKGIDSKMRIQVSLSVTTVIMLMVVPHFCHIFYLPNSLKPNGIIIPITMRHELFAFILSERKFPLNLTGKGKWKPSREKGFSESRLELRLRHNHYPHNHVLTNTLFTQCS